MGPKPGFWDDRRKWRQNFWQSEEIKTKDFFQFSSHVKTEEWRPAENIKCEDRILKFEDPKINYGWLDRQ